ncbi:MAG: DUF4229 domain-containing protein [Microbacterium sp.]
MSKNVGQIILYTVLRIAFFVVPLLLMLMLPIFQQLWWLAAIFAAIIGLSLSVILLSKPLGKTSERLVERAAARTKPTQAELDAEAEDVD